MYIMIITIVNTYRGEGGGGRPEKGLKNVRPTAPRIPRRSPVQVLTRLDVA